MRDAHCWGARGDRKASVPARVHWYTSRAGGPIGKEQSRADRRDFGLRHHVDSGSAARLGSLPKVSVAVGASNLATPLKAAMRTVFLLPAADWIAIAVIALVVAMTETQVRKLLVLLCGIGCL